MSSFLLDITGEIDSFVGLIYSTNDLQESLSALTLNPEKFVVFMGTDEVMSEVNYDEYNYIYIYFFVGYVGGSCKWVYLYNG